MTVAGRVAVGHPVDVATGTLFNDYTDFVLRGLVPLALLRHYSTALIHRAPAVLGPGWRHLYQHELRQTLEGFVYTDWRGAEIALPDDGAFDRDHRLVVPAAEIELRGDRDRLMLENYGSPAPEQRLLFVRRPRSTQYQLAAILAHPNNRIDLAYDARGRLRSATASRSGYALTFAYDGADRITEVTCQAGRRDLVARFAYDDAGDLASVVDARGVAARYQYQDHRMVSETQRGGAPHEFRFDGEGRCIFASGADGFEQRTLRYDANARTTVVLDSKSAATTYVWNERGQVVETTDPLGGVEQTTYDADGRIVLHVDALGNAFARAYDAFGHLTEIAYPDGGTYVLTWNDEHLPVAAAGPSGLRWHYEYDANKRLTKTRNPLGHEHVYGHTAWGEIESVTTPFGATYRYLYNAVGHFVGFVEPRGHATHHVVDDHGNPLRIVDANGNATMLRYDDVDRLVEVRDPDGACWRWDYDSQGRVVRSHLPAGETIENTYNTCGQLVAIRRADGVVARAEWDTEPGRILAIHDGAGRTLRYEYDVLGRPVARHNWDGSVSRYEYDALGRVTAVVAADGTRQTCEYDAMGSMIRRKVGDDETAFAYDVNGFLIEAIGPRHEVKWERDLYGRATAEIQDGRRVEFDYDSGGRRDALRTALGDEFRYAWDVASQLERTSCGGHEVAFSYDARGRELGRTFTGGSTFQRRYDVMGRVLDEWFAPHGAAADAAAGPDGVGQRPVPLRRRYSYDRAGHLAFVQDSARGNMQLFHDVVGQLRGVVHASGAAEYYDFDAVGNRTAVARVRSPKPPPVDDVLVPKTGRRVLDLPALAAAGAESEELAIGPGNRIRSVRTAAGKIDYELDAAGYVVRKRRLAADGNRIDEWRFVWDGDGNLAAIERANGVRHDYEYDPLGRRVRKLGPEGTVVYVWDGDRVLHEIGGREQPITYVYNPREFDLLMRKRGDVVDYGLPDVSTAPTEFVGEDGVVAWSRQAAPWGRAVAASDGDPSFTGQWVDAESGLHYNHFRYYDPDLGRYLSPDPVGLLGGLNEYAFVPSPIEAFDPDGLAKALGGGPMTYNGGYDRNGRPTLRDPASREVTGGGRPAYGDRRVPSPGGPSATGPDSGGKCLAVLHGPGADAPHAFVSGQGRPPIHAREGVPASWHVTPGHMGNWTHAEMQALHFLHRTGTPGTYHLYIDRPCCPRCDASVPHAVAALRERGIIVNVHFMETDDAGRTRWHTLDTAHTCG